MTNGWKVITQLVDQYSVIIYLGIWVELKKTRVHNKQQIRSEIINGIDDSPPSSALQFWTAVAAIVLFFFAFH